jgi:putative tricarboxylic transport membrane protein
MNFEAILTGLFFVFQWKSILAIFFGVWWGTIGGIIPGISATIAMALLLPFTWGMDPTVAIMMLAGVYCGGEYGGSIPACLIGTPGTNAAACTVLDGYELHKQGKTGLALYVSLTSSVFGGLFSAIALIFLAIPLAEVAVTFGPSEYFALSMLGLTMICSLGGKNVIKGILAGLIGILVSTIGFDPFSGVARFTFGNFDLMQGIDMVCLMLGLFAVSEMFVQAKDYVRNKIDFDLSNQQTDTSFPSLRELKTFLPYNIFASIMGIIIGILPGAGGTTATFVTYGETKRWSKDPDSFGKGNPIGVAVCESANNAVTGGAMVPLLALGIPGSNSTAIMLGALMIHNVSPGPLLFTKTPEIPSSIFISLIVANLFLLIVGYICIKFAIKFTSIKKSALVSIILALVFTGIYAYAGDTFSIWICLAFGLLGVGFRFFGLPNAAIVLGFVLGFLVEANFRRALIVSDGSYFNVFSNSTISTVLNIASILSVTAVLYRELRTRETTA